MTSEKRDLWENPPKGHELMWRINHWDGTVEQILVGPVRKDGKRKALYKRYQHANPWNGKFEAPSGSLVRPQSLYATEASAWEALKEREVNTIVNAERTIRKSNEAIVAANKRLDELQRETA